MKILDLFSRKKGKKEASGAITSQRTSQLIPAIPTQEASPLVATAPVQEAPPMGATTPAEEVPQLVQVGRSIPFDGSLVVSPDESLVCWASPNNAIVAYESGSDYPKWSLAVPSSAGCDCRFVGPERLLVQSEKSSDQSLIQLVNTADGSVIAQTIGPFMFSSYGDADIRTNRYVGGAPFIIVIIQTAGDKIELSTWKGGQIDLPGPKIGPEGKCYLIMMGKLLRIDGNEATPIMPGGNCIHFETPAKVYCGDGYADRSGSSALNMADLESGMTSAISWGYEPVSEIAPAGKDHLLIASRSDFKGIYHSSLTMFSIANKSKEWSLIIGDLYQARPVLLTSVPEEGWALIQTGKLIKLISLEDGRTLHVLQKESQQFAIAKWLASKKLLYIAGVTYNARPGFLECYRI